MTQEEFVTQNSKVSDYSRLQEKEKKYTYSRNLIELGILNIVTAYQKQVSFAENRDLEVKIISAICSAYDSELETIREDMEKL